MLPSPDELLKCHQDDFKHPVEKVEILSILKKIRLNGFGHLARIPEWLETGISVVQMVDEGNYFDCCDCYELVRKLILFILVSRHSVGSTISVDKGRI